MGGNDNWNFAQEVQHANGRAAFDCCKSCGANLRYVGRRHFRLRGNTACCNTAAESRRESALVDAKISGYHFRLLTALFQIMKYKAKEAKQRLACPP